MEKKDSFDERRFSYRIWVKSHITTRYERNALHKDITRYTLRQFLEQFVHEIKISNTKKLLNFTFSVTECATQVYKSQSVETAVVIKPPAVVNDDFITQTVYGFLDFTTTIGNTVMVFSPQSAPAGIILQILLLEKSLLTFSRYHLLIQSTPMFPSFSTEP